MAQCVAAEPQRAGRLGQVLSRRSQRAVDELALEALRGCVVVGWRNLGGRGRCWLPTGLAHDAVGQVLQPHALAATDTDCTLTIKPEVVKDKDGVSALLLVCDIAARANSSKAGCTPR